MCAKQIATHSLFVDQSHPSPHPPGAAAGAAVNLAISAAAHAAPAQRDRILQEAAAKVGCTVPTGIGCTLILCFTLYVTQAFADRLAQSDATAHARDAPPSAPQGPRAPATYTPPKWSGVPHG